MASSKIKELCILAYEKQMESLITSEGEDASLLQTLKAELREVRLSLT